MRELDRIKKLWAATAGTTARYELFAIMQFEHLAESRDLTPKKLIALLADHYDDPESNYARLAAMPECDPNRPRPLPPVVAALRGIE